ncbi:PIG-L family deacetylase [Pedobacter sp.]|uniref:PIG-L family deacetylase n=1 Tax=Pedobacter sp. TaxID=1411316 RepID=UPI003D7F9A70
MKLRTRFFFFLSLISPILKAQNTASLNAAEIKQGLESLQVSGSVLYVAAHPDDENTKLLAYLAKEKKVRAGYLSITRGDGGQNLIGTEQADLLGLLRTQELLAARRIDGAEQFFTRANDFGFSNPPEESFEFWNKQQVLGDMVWVIRKFQPQVIITRFPEDARAGHGNHTASAMLAHEAFKAAADPKQFPEQLKFVKPWQARRIVWNTFNFGTVNTTADDQLKLNVGGYNALLGKSYGEIAASSRSQHRSQGFGAAAQRTPSIEYFSHVDGVPAKKDLFEDIDFSLSSAPGMATVEKLVAKINQEYQVAQPYASLKLLLELRKAVNGKPFKHALLDELILACAGIWIETNVSVPTYAITDDIPVQVQALARSPIAIPIKIVVTPKGLHPLSGPLSSQMTDFKFTIPASTIGLTQPYWLEKKHPLGYYIVDSLALIGLPENPAPVMGEIKMEIGDQQIVVIRPLLHKYTDPEKGEIYRPLVVAPPVTATLPDKAFVFKKGESRTFVVQLNNFKAHVKGVLKPAVTAGWKISPATIAFNFDKKGEDQEVTFSVIPAGNVTEGTLQLQLEVEGKTYAKGLQEINYEHIPVQTLFPLAEAKVSAAEINIAGKRIGYLNGAGDLVAAALKQIGYQVTLLTENQVLHGDLSSYDAIITGVRLFNINPLAAVLQSRLMKYVADGGTLVSQYNVNSPLKIEELGPYPFKLTRARVTAEDAEVTFLAPDHQVLNYPNKITKKDFEGWVQERGLYFAKELDPRYTAILSMNDKGEPAEHGSLFVTKYGKGKYVYTGLAFFRELPAGVPGAFRLFANLIANPQ